MNVLLIGSGAREHALAWSMARSPHCTALFAAPGNPGIGSLATLLPADVGDPASILAAARQVGAALVVIGPELPLVAGAASLLEDNGIAVLGPSASAAELEGSKAWAKRFMARHHVPTAPFGVFVDYEEAARFIDQAGRPLVVKADGLASGKGVFVCDTPAEAHAAARSLLEARSLGAAGARIVVEWRLSGPELSVFALCDGERFWMLPVARDHKTLHEGNAGPMTGGMGAFSPVAEISPALLERVERQVFARTLHGMAREGRPFRGFLFAGLMLTQEGPIVLEFNCRLGDPETQALVARVRGDLVEIFQQAATGALPAAPPPGLFSEDAAVGVVLAAHGYPSAPRRGDVIVGLAEAEAHALVFHAGTAQQGDALVTSGGRVLTVVGRGPDLAAARARAYAAAELIHFDGKQLRRDIGA